METLALKLCWQFGRFCVSYCQFLVHSLEDPMQWVVACLLFITGMVAYFPVIYIRKMNRLIKVLEQIEANTRK